MSVLEEASALIEGYSEQESERQRAKRLRRDVLATSWKRTFEVASANYEFLLRTSTELDEIRAALAAREAARPDMLAYNEIESMLQSMAKVAPAKIDARAESAVGPALEWLNGQMSELMSFVRELDRDLGSVSSIEDAIRDDKLIKTWRDIEDAADRYQEIRRAQETICRKTAVFDGPALTQLLNGVGRLKNAFDHDRVWIDERKPRKAAERGPYDRAFLDWLEDPPSPAYDWAVPGGPGVPVWPSDAQSPLDARATRTADRIEALRWMARNHAPWVPTFKQMRAAVDDIAAMLTRLDTIALTRRALEAFDRYYTQRGVTPVKPFDGRAALAAMPQPRGLRDNRDREGRMHTDPRILAVTGE